MPPCHGGDRRFESGRARQVFTLYNKCCIVFFIMGIESGPTGHFEVERVVLPYSDENLRDAVLDQEGSRAVYEHDPVLWLRGAIGVDTERGASEVTDHELAEKLVNGGFAEWDPDVVKAVKARLDAVGIRYII